MSGLPLVPTPQEKANQDACVGVSTALTVMSVIVVSLRVYTRTVIVGQIGNDDWAMLVALLFTITYLVTIFIMKNNGMGFGGRLLTMNQMRSQIQTTLAIEIIYYILINAIKTSILFCYLRIAAGRRLAVLSKGTIYFLLTFGSVCVVVCLTQCIPLHKMWDLTGTVPGKCINTTALFYTTSSLNILIDVWIIALPVPTLLQIQRPTREKMALIFVFGLGVFSCIASIVRLHSIRIYTESSDPFYDSVPINLWSMVEVNVGIWCASIPSLKALFIRAQRERSKNASGSNGSYEFHSRGKSGGVTGKMGGSNSTGNGSIGTVIDSNAAEPGVNNGQDIRNHREWANSEERILAPGGAR